MLFPHETYIGIDPTAGSKPIVYAAIDQELRMIALGGGESDEVLAFVGGQNKAVVSLCSPLRPNQGLMADELFRQSLSPQPKPNRWKNYRVSEYILRVHNIHITPTPDAESNCPKWMQVGFMLLKQIANMDFQPYGQTQDDLQYLEVYPQASYAVLLDQNPLPKHTLEGRLQRQLILFESNIDLSDPMGFFEEITRHRLLNGILPMDILYTAEELDALVAAYCAWMAINKPNQITLIGDPQEGQICLPGTELKTKY
jgi:hypothetical protein